MIHSARPTVLPVANIVFNLFWFAKFWKVDGQATFVKTMITTGRDCGLAEWINNFVYPYAHKDPVFMTLMCEQMRILLVDHKIFCVPFSFLHAIEMSFMCN